jgi:sulfatase maturation enzyme AslB (radical SAM superfamily)
MKLPKQSQPILRNIATATVSGTGINPSTIYTIDTDNLSARNCNLACSYCSQCEKR